MKTAAILILSLVSVSRVYSGITTDAPSATVTLLPHPLPAIPYVYAGENNVGATMSAGEPNPFAPATTMGAAVWVVMDPGRLGVLQVDTQGANFDTLLAAYEARFAYGPNAAFPTWVPLDKNDDFVATGGPSRVTVPCDGTKRMLQIGGYNGAVGSFPLNFRWLPMPEDTFATRSAVFSSVEVSNNTEGTVEAGEYLPTNLAQMQATHWFEWTAPFEGQTTVHTANSNFDTMLAVYRANGSSLPRAADLVASNDDASPLTTSLVTFYALAEEKFYFQVGGYSTSRGALIITANTIPAIKMRVAGLSATHPYEDVVSNFTAFPNTPHVLACVLKLGATKRFDYTIFNEGTIPLLISNFQATQPAMLKAPGTLTVLTAPPASIPAGGSASYAIAYTPTFEDDQNQIEIGFTSNAPNFTFHHNTISSSAYSADLDSDGDGVNNFAEASLPLLGFHPQISDDTAKLAMLRRNGALAGLFTQSQLQTMAGGASFAPRDPVTGKFVMRLALRKSADLVNWSPFPLVPASTSVEADGRLRFEFDEPSNAAFFKFVGE
jgi:hypothetical protein